MDITGQRILLRGLWKDSNAASGGVGFSVYSSNFTKDAHILKGVAKTFSDLYTTTRASVAWDVVDGVLEEYAVNEPILNSKGLGVWEAATNKITNSNNTSSWTGTSSAPVAATSIGDSLGLTAYTFTGDGVANRNRFINVGPLTSSPETLYFILEQDSAATSVVYLYDSTAAAQVGYTEFNWTTKGLTTVTGTAGTGATGSAELLDSVGPNGGEVYLISLTVTPNNAGNTGLAYLYPTGFAANTDSVTVHHAQYCELDYVTPPILTDAVAVTRNADVIINNAAITDWYNDDEGTLLVEGSSLAASGNLRIVEMSKAASAADSHILRWSSIAAGTLRCETYVGGTAVGLVTDSDVSKPAGTSIAYAYKVNDIEAGQDGTIIGADGIATMPSGVSHVYLGASFAATAHLNGYIQKFEYYDTRLPQAALESLTLEALPLIAYESDFVANTYQTNQDIKSFNEQYTVTRASKAWDVVDGVLEEYAINEPMLSSKGLGVWEASTNLVPKSNNFAAAGSGWGDAGNFITSTATSFGDSLGLTAYKQVNNNTAAARAVKQTLGTLTAARESFTFIVENVDALETTLIVDDLTTAGQVMYMTFTWSTEAISFGTATRGTSPEGTATKLADAGPNGGALYKLTVSAVPVTAGNTRQMRLFYTGLSQNGLSVIAHHVQYGEQSYEAPVILTNGSTVTRETDVIVNNAPISSWYNQNEGTIFVEANSHSALGVGSNNFVTDFSDGSTANAIRSYYDRGISAARPATVMFAGSAFQGSIVATGDSYLQGMRYAQAYKLNDRQLAIDGTSIGTDLTATMPTGIDKINIGTDLSGSSPLNGYIQKLTYYRERLSQANLEDITAVPVVPVAPLFEFGATAGELAALGGNTPADIEPDGASSITLIADDVVHQYSQMQAGLTIPLSTGNLYIPATTSDWVALEVEFELPALDSPSNTDGLQMTLNLAGTGGGNIVAFVSGVNTGGFYTLITPETIATSVSTATGGLVRVGIDFKPSTGDVIMSINGTSGSAYSVALSQEIFPILGMNEASLSVGTDAGKKVIGRLIQHSTYFTETHVGGAVALANALKAKV